MNIPKLRTTRHRIVIDPKGEEFTWVPDKYKEKQWKRIKDPNLFLKIWGESFRGIANEMYKYIIFIHESDPYFSKGTEFVKIKKELLKEYGQKLELHFFNKGLSAIDVEEKLTMYDVADAIFELTGHKVKFDLYNSTYTIEKRKILTPEEYKDFTKEQLQDECVYFKLSSKSGTKEEILARLEKARIELEAKNK